MKKVIAVLMINLCLASTVLAADFIDGFEDIPLMSGFKQIKNKNFSFENEETGYIEAYLVTSKKINFDEVKNFYTDVLPKFGWILRETNHKSLVFEREKDVLEILKQKSFPLTLSINLKSKN